MKEFVVQRINDARGHWEDEASSFAKHEAVRFLREARREHGDYNVRMIARRTVH